MAVDSKHPLYTEFLPDWEQMRDTYRGQRIVKQKGFRYLPATSGMVDAGLHNRESAGFKEYDAYRKRAVFPDVVREAVEALLGVMHNKPASIDIPEKMASLLTSATSKGESLQMLLRKINMEQLIMGRVGLLADIADAGDMLGQPYIVTYNAETILNWDDSSSDSSVEIDNLNFVLLDESGPERDAEFEWKDVRKHRVLILGDPQANEPAGEGVYMAGQFSESASFNMDDMLVPRTSGVGGGELDRIPFVFINGKDIVADPEDPPLLGLSNLALTIYRGEADYRQALFMQGQDTLVVIGGKEDGKYRMGSQGGIKLPLNADAKFIGVSSSGLPEIRESLSADYGRAEKKGGQLMDTVSREKESGDALKIRVAAKTATLNQIALAGAFGLEQLLKTIARWVGANPEDVHVEPNLDFTDDEMTGQDLAQLMGAKAMGAPLARETIHERMQDKGITSLTYEEEKERMRAEQGEEDEFGAGVDVGGSTSEDGPVKDDEEDDQNRQAPE